MPNRNIEGEYRYAYQGQEKDGETGMEAFELRLWDSRIGRWLTVDPYGQYFSPYMGMGNNPMNGIDPDGGCFKSDGSDCDQNAAIGTTTIGGGGLEWRMTEEGYVPHNIDDALQFTAVVGEASFMDIIGAPATPTMFFSDNGRTIGVYQDYERKEAAMFTVQLTMAAYGAGASAAFPNVLSGGQVTNRSYNFVGGLAPKTYHASITIRNAHLAGKTHPVTNVPFNNKGFPDFKNFLFKGGKNDVTIALTGNRAKDFAAANKAAGYNSTPKGYTWHHHQVKGRMQLVQTSVHNRTGHTGGFSLFKL